MPKYPQQTVVIQSASTSGLAIAGLIFSIIGWFTCGLLCIPGAFLCFLALFSQGPKGTAIAGLIVGFPGTLFFAFVGFAMLMGFLGLGAAATNSAIRDAEQSQVQDQAPSVEDTVDEPAAEFVPGTSAEQPDEINLDGSAETPPSVRGFNDYSVNVQNLGEVSMCQVTFKSLPPTYDIAAEVVRNSLEMLVKKDGSREILAMAFDASGDSLPELQYGGTLLYKPSDGKILTMDERNGLQATEVDEGPYFVRVEDSKTASGITPAKKWFNAFIVFQNEPPATEVKAAVLKEIEKLKPRGMDVNVYVYTGDKSNRITWMQIKAPNDNFMAVDYVVTTGEISPNWNWDSVEDSVDEQQKVDEPADMAEVVEAAKWRTWTAANGKYKIEAKLVKFTAGTVTLEKKDGSTVDVKLSRLCSDDQDFVKRRSDN